MINTFKEKQGVIVNPYIGFTSFQHFRGEKLYSDCVTGRQGKAGTETESYECYPVTPGVEEKGREQGFHPDTTVAYIRILWKEFEPKQGEYNYAFIEDILSKAKAKGQTVMFRLMAHSTCERDDVPDWLKEMMPCPARPEGMRVKDSPTDPRYLKLFGKAIEKLGERFDKDETLDSVDISLGGAWGEGSQDFPQEEMRALMDLYVRVFPNTKLMGQLSNADLLQHISKQRPIGYRADGTASPPHMDIYYPEFFAALGEDNYWKSAPISFEAYWWISEWYRQGWDIDRVIQMTLDKHISTFNNKSFPIPYEEWREKIEYWLTKMGYRFYIQEIETSENVCKGETLSLRMVLTNTGVAPIYNKLPLYIRLKNATATYTFQTEVDITKWLPGTYTENISVELPQDITAGEYELQVGIGGGDKPEVRFASDTKEDGAYTVLAKVEVR